MLKSISQIQDLDNHRPSVPELSMSFASMIRLCAFHLKAVVGSDILYMACKRRHDTASTSAGRRHTHTLSNTNTLKHKHTRTRIYTHKRIHIHFYVTHVYGFAQGDAR